MKFLIDEVFYRNINKFVRSGYDLVSVGGTLKGDYATLRSAFDEISLFLYFEREDYDKDLDRLPAAE